MADRLSETGLTNEIEFLMARARAAGTISANARLQPLGLKVRSFSVLSLACSDVNPSQRELASFLSLDASQIVALVDDLEERGLVVREADPRDRRSNVIKATDAGRALHAKAQVQANLAQDESLSALTAEETEQLRKLLYRVAFSAD